MRDQRGDEIEIARRVDRDLELGEHARRRVTEELPQQLLVATAPLEQQARLADEAVIEGERAALEQVLRERGLDVAAQDLEVGDERARHQRFLRLLEDPALRLDQLDIARVECEPVLHDDERAAGMPEIGRAHV